MVNRSSLAPQAALARFTCKSRASQKCRSDLTRLWQCSTPSLFPKQRRHSRRWPSRILSAAWRTGESPLRLSEVCTEDGQGRIPARENRQPTRRRSSVQKPNASGDTLQPSVSFIKALVALVMKLGCEHTRRHCSSYTKNIPMTTRQKFFTPTL